MTNLTCPRCERPTVKEENLSYSRLGRVRECTTCKKSSVWLVSNSYTKSDYIHQDQEWKSWEIFSCEKAGVNNV